MVYESQSTMHPPSSSSSLKSLSPRMGRKKIKISLKPTTTISTTSKPRPWNRDHVTTTTFGVTPQTWSTLERGMYHFQPLKCVFTVTSPSPTVEGGFNVVLHTRLDRILFPIEEGDESKEDEGMEEMDEWKTQIKRVQALEQRLQLEVPLEYSGGFREALPIGVQCFKCRADTREDAMQVLMVLSKHMTPSLQTRRVVMKPAQRKGVKDIEGETELEIYVLHKYTYDHIIKSLRCWFHEIPDGNTLYQTVDLACEYTGARFYVL